MNTKQLADIYRRAAEKIDKGEEEFTCCAVSRGVGIRYSVPARLYAETIQFGNTYEVAAEISNHTPRPVQVRVLLLLLMAEWVLTDLEGRIR